MEIMDEYRTAKRVSIAEVSGERVRGRPKLRSMENVNLLPSVTSLCYHE